MAENPTQDMSPEEIAKLQKENCIFCKIIAGEIPSFKVYEDKLCVGILDINPASAGHVLLLPKEHYAIMPVLPEDLLKHLSLTSQKISNALLTSLQVQGTTLFIANGQYAGQKAPHVMIHIIPRSKSEKLSNFTLSGEPQDAQQTAALAQKLQHTISVMLAKRLESKGIQPASSEQQSSAPTDGMAQRKMEEQVKENLRSIITQEEQLQDLLIQSPEQFIELIQSSPTMKATLEKIDLPTVVHELQTELKPEEQEVSDETHTKDTTQSATEDEPTDKTEQEREEPAEEMIPQKPDTQESTEDEHEPQEKPSSQEEDGQKKDSVNLDDIANLFS